MADPRIPRDVNEAVYDLVRDFGADNLSRLTGVPAGTISNKANHNDTSHHKPTLSDAIIWTNLSGDKRIAEAFSRSCGGVFVDLGGLASISDEALLELVLERGRQAGEADAALNALLGRSRITRADFVRLRIEEMEAVAARLAVLFRVEGLVR